MSKNDDKFNPAFKNLNKKLKKVEKAKNKPSKVKLPSKEKIDDKVAFNTAMSGVKPMNNKRGKFIPAPGSRPKPLHPPPNEEQEVMSHLYGLVMGSVEMDITFSDEYMEGSVKGFSKKMMKKLKKGEIPVKNFIDLHGLTKKEAEGEVKAFLLNSHKQGHRCVLIVHGRGLNSPDSFPVLKEGLPRWLGTGSAKKIVLAFATARPYDGGTGAIYVLLRKR